MRSNAAINLASLTSDLVPALATLGPVVDAVNQTIQGVNQAADGPFVGLDNLVNLEANELDTSRLGIIDRLAQLENTMVAAVVEDARDVLSLLGEDATYQDTIMTSMSQQVRAFIEQENSRAAVKEKALNTVASATPEQIQTVLSSLVSAQVTSNNALANSKVSSMTSLKITAQSGSTDANTWYVVKLISLLRII
jgi:hypothetical protein